MWWTDGQNYDSQDRDSMSASRGKNRSTLSKVMRKSWLPQAPCTSGLLSCWKNEVVEIRRVAGRNCCNSITLRLNSLESVIDECQSVNRLLLVTRLYWCCQLVSWSLTSLFSTNMAISETMMLSVTERQLWVKRFLATSSFLIILRVFRCGHCKYLFVSEQKWC